MTEPIAGLATNGPGVAARAMVTAHGCESVILPVLESMFARGGKIYLLGNQRLALRRFDAGALWSHADATRRIGEQGRPCANGCP